MHTGVAILEDSAEVPGLFKCRTPTALGIYSKNMSGVLPLHAYFSVSHNSQGVQAVKVSKS